MPLHMDFWQFLATHSAAFAPPTHRALKKLTVTTHRKRNISNAVRSINMHQENL